MLRRVGSVLALWIVCGAAGAAAQPIEVTSDVDRLAFLIPRLYGPDGLFVDTFFRQFDHQAHFNSAFQAEFTQFNLALTSQLAAVPLPSPASGFTYTFDPEVGAFSRSTQSFGPIFAERAETIGRNKFAFGTSFQHFSFDTLEGLDLDAIPAVFTHDQIPTIEFAFEDDIVTTLNLIDATVSQFTFFFTYGLTNRLDLSLAVPIVNAEMSVTSNATIQRISGSDPTIHFFEERGLELGERRVFQASGSATGLGDLIVRVKTTAVKSAGAGLGLGADLRLPTGEEEDLLGSGAPGFKPFAALSFARGRFSPHANVAYQWNGDSILAGDVLTGEEGDFPDQLFYAFGFDAGIADRLTLAFDILGQRVIDSPRVFFTDLVAADGTVFQNIEVGTESFDILDGAAGLKLNLAQSLLLDFAVRFKLNDTGLRDAATPLIGIEYTF